MTRERILEAARSWTGTPYQHQASLKGAGCDCLGLIRGVWRDIYGDEPLIVPPYTPDWAEEKGEETLLLAARHCLISIEKQTARPGDVIMFRMKFGVPCKHIAILSSPHTMIHAYWGRCVLETYLVPYWQRRWAYSFAFPAIKE